MTTFNLRPANAGDAQAIARVHVQTYRTAYASILPQRYLDAFTVERRTAIWAKLIANRDTAEQITVGEDDQQIQAFAHYGKSRDLNAATTSGELWSLYVAHDQWRHNLGRQLLAESVQWFRRLGFDTAILWVLVANKPARKFYERLGWSADGAEKGSEERIEARYRLDLKALL